MSLISIAAAAVTHVLIVTLFIHIFVIISIFNLHLQKKIEQDLFRSKALLTPLKTSIYFGPKPFLFPFIITSSLSPSSLLVLQQLQCLDSSPSEEPSAVIASSLCFSLPLGHPFYPSFVISISYFATTRTAEERQEEPESVPSRNLSAAATQASGKRK